MKCSLGISNFLEEISSLSHSIVFLYFFALIPEEGFLISPCYSLELCSQMGISFLLSFAFRFCSFHSDLSGLLRQPFCFLHFFFLWMVFIPVSCTKASRFLICSLVPRNIFPIFVRAFKYIYKVHSVRCHGVSSEWGRNPSQVLGKRESRSNWTPYYSSVSLRIPSVIPTVKTCDILTTKG